MPAESKSQQRLMGMVYAYKSGELDLSTLSPSLRKKIVEISKNMTMEEAKEFAATVHKDLPEKIKEGTLIMDKAQKVFQKWSQAKSPFKPSGKLHLYEGGTPHAKKVKGEFASMGRYVPKYTPVISDTSRGPLGIHSTVTHIAYGGKKDPSYTITKKRMDIGKGKDRSLSVKTTSGGSSPKQVTQYVKTVSKKRGKVSHPAPKNTPKA